MVVYLENGCVNMMIMGMIENNTYNTEDGSLLINTPSNSMKGEIGLSMFIQITQTSKLSPPTNTP